MIFGPKGRIMTMTINNRSEGGYSTREHLEPFFTQEFIVANMFIIITFLKKILAK